MKFMMSEVSIFNLNFLRLGCPNHILMSFVLQELSQKGAWLILKLLLISFNAIVKLSLYLTISEKLSMPKDKKLIKFHILEMRRGLWLLLDFNFHLIRNHDDDRPREAQLTIIS
ncbi:hypothetical protein BpHYR1_022777 [Brachionus plicatilis]|uniref:Uncharacterized protein n=1 Tax=Brachionus plicatilis TaxID=10195 RepID=A0A3M7QLD3_BRAPC|nr:hypothetical protein BpHYR1_022777 [Brachionus plicatilis]